MSTSQPVREPATTSHPLHDPNDPRTTAHGTFKITVPTTNEDKAGNPLHAYLFVALTAYLALKRKESTVVVVAASVAAAWKSRNEEVVPVVRRPFA